jgi:hypothetical protein
MIKNYTIYSNKLTDLDNLEKAPDPILNKVYIFNKKISDQEKLNYNINISEICFFHIEKCMGTSLRFMLYDYFLNIFNKDDIYVPEYNNDINLNTNDNLKTIYSINNCKVILAHCSYNKLNVTDHFSDYCFSITCVRDPIDRFISHYNYFLKKNTNKNIQELTDDELNKIIHYNKNTINWRLSGETNNINDSINNIKKINCILIMEKIESDIIILNNILNSIYNINKKINIIKTNTSMDTSINISINTSNITDYDYIKKNYLDDFEDDYEIYNYILNMKIEDRIRI